jgi:hypothetical protein
MPKIKKSEGSLKKQAYKGSVADGFADALFKSAWAEFEEEQGTSFSGMEILDVAPDTPQDVKSFASRKISEIESANSISLDSFVPPGEQEGSFDPWELGWYLGMQYLGHGVSWMDDHEDHGLKIPSGEFSILDHDPENNKYEFWMEGSMKKKTAQPQSPPQSPPQSAQYRAVITLQPSGEIVYGEWDAAEETAKTIGEEWGKDLVKRGAAASFTVTIETGEQASSGQPLAPDLGEADWESALKGLGSQRKKRAQGFPLFSNEGKEFIISHTSLAASQLATKKGGAASIEQAKEYINAGLAEAEREIAKIVSPSARAVIYEPNTYKQMFKQLFPQFELPKEEQLAISPPPPPAPTPALAAPPAPAQPPQEELPAAAASRRLPQQLRNAFNNSYAYDAIATVLQADLGHNYPKEYKADELIDEEELILDVVQQAFPELPRANLTEAFGDVLTDSYNP